MTNIQEELTKLVRGNTAFDVFTRAAFATDASIYQIMPMCVISPKDTADVIAVVKYAKEHNIPIVARGAGSGLAGEALGSGIVFDMTRYMSKIDNIEQDGSRIICQPGAVLDDINNALAKYGKKIGPDPSSGNRATIGGIVANNATGAHSLVYGYIADHVEKVEAVLADSSIVEFTNNMSTDTGAAEQCYSLLSPKADVIQKALPRTKRNRSGYGIANICHNGKIDMARLMAGSEGTLAIFTQITLRTVDVPKAKGLVQIEFASLDNMAKAVPIIVDSGAAACELMDQTLTKMAVDAYPAYRDVLPVDAVVSLVVEHIGQDQDEVKEKIQKTLAAIGPLAAKHHIYLDAVSQARLWKSRKDAVPLLSRDKTDKKAIGVIEDVSVENVRLAEYVIGINKIAEKYKMPLVYYGHAGDGEMHIRPYLDLSKPDDIETLKKIAAEVFELAWSLGGTISGEHADGLVRTPFIKRQYGDEFYELLRQVKNIFDPQGIMNPGKIINDDPDIMTKNLKAAYKYNTDRLKTNLFFEPDEYRLEISQCNGDALCRSTQNGVRMCPVFRAMGDEIGCSRAKANLLRFWITGLISDEDFESDDFKRLLDMCVNCKMCSVQCPSGVDISKLIIEARAEYGKRKGFSPAVRLLSRNRILSAFGNLFAPVANTVISLPPFKWFLEKTTGLDKTRSLPKFEFGTFIRKGRKYLANCPPITQPIDKVAYFTDCYVNYNDHSLGFAVIKTLRHNDIDVIIPNQLPAPVPAVVYGNIKTARADLAYSVKYLADAIREGYKIICSEPSAAMCLKHELRFFLKGDDAKLVSENTYELMSYLADLHKQNKLKAPAASIADSFAYHMPCHMCALGGEGASIKLLYKLCGSAVTDINAGCCGLAGTFGMQAKNRDLSADIGAQMAAALGATKGKYAMTECSACKMQIEHLTDKVVKHPIKVLAQAYGL
jgi:anaerobic glycerol-3-phosphate dehydrogenase C subunit